MNHKVKPINCLGEEIKGRYYTAEFFQKITGVNLLPITNFIKEHNHRKGK